MYFFRLAFAAVPSPTPIGPFPPPVRRTGRADFPHPALSRDHAFAHGRYLVVRARHVRPHSPLAPPMPTGRPGRGMPRSSPFCSGLAFAGDLDRAGGTLTVRGKAGRDRLAYTGANGADAAIGAWLKIRGDHDGPLFAPVNRGGAGQRRGNVPPGNQRAGGHSGPASGIGRPPGVSRPPADVRYGPTGRRKRRAGRRRVRGSPFRRHDTTV